MAAVVKRAVLPHPHDPTLALVQLTRGQFAVISAVDAHAVGQWNWACMISTQTNYAHRSVKRAGRKWTEYLHRFIAREMGASTGSDIDHVNGNGLDCRRSNLRPASRAQNLRNSKRRRDNTSGIRGVTFDKRRGKWSSRVQVDGKNVHLGYFDNLPDAATARARGSLKYHGEYASERGVSWQQ